VCGCVWVCVVGPPGRGVEGRRGGNCVRAAERQFVECRGAVSVFKAAGRGSVWACVHSVCS